MAWFSTATKHFSKSAGYKTLHPVVDLNSAERFKPLCLAKRKTSFWPWKDPKIIPTPLVLNDILLESIKVDASAKLFIENYEDKPQLKLDGDLGAKLATELSLDLSTVDSFSMVAQFGDIIKTEINWQDMEQALAMTRVNMSHELLQEMQGNTRTSLCLVLESLAVKKDCMLSASSDEKVTSDDSVDIPKSPVTINVHAKGNVENITQHHYEIPVGTVLAYSCNVIDVKSNGELHLHIGTDRIDNSPDSAIPEFDAEAEIKDLEREIRPLVSSSEAMEVGTALYALLGTDCISQLLEIVSYAHLIVSEGKDFSIPIKELRGQCPVQTDECIALLEQIGFHEGSKEAFCYSHKEDELLQSSWAILECLADMSTNQRSLLKELSAKNREILLRVIENGLKQQMSYAAEGCLRDVLKWSGAEKSIFTTLGFSTVNGNINYHWQKGDQLKDAYVALRLLTNL